MAGGTGAWLYAITPRIDASLLSGVTGVGGVPVHVVEATGLSAVVASVDLAEFGEEPLRRNFEDPTWLETTARAHDGVIACLSRLGPTVPVRLATVYHDDNRVRAMLEDRHDDFWAVLRRIAGRTEWGVKVYTDSRAPATSASPTAEPAEDGGSGPGATYLARRREQLSAQEAAEHTNAEHASDIHAELERVAVSAKLYVPQHPALAEEPGPMILNGSYLVDDDRTDQFTARVDSLAAEYHGVKIELTGPWPAYSFASIEEEAQR